MKIKDTIIKDDEIIGYTDGIDKDLIREPRMATIYLRNGLKLVCKTFTNNWGGIEVSETEYTEIINKLRILFNE